MIDPLSTLIGMGKLISSAKALKTVSDFVTEDREAKRRAKEAREEEERLEKTIDTIANRSFFDALMMYVIAAFAGAFLISKGILGIVITILLFLAHCSSLDKLRRYISIKREIMLSCVLAAVFLIAILKYFF